MGEETGISWTESTWNPWMGCTKVSPGCAHCYMFREQRQYGNDPELVRRSKTKFREPVSWPEGKLVFTCSWSDWFHPEADQWRPEAWEIIRATPRHTYQILTKRPELIAERLPEDWGDGYPNVWLGVSIENSRFTWRADELRQIPAALRFISAEPLLGSLFMDRVLPSDTRQGHSTPDAPEGGEAAARAVAPLDLTGFGWVIVGGESGSRNDARPMHPEWAREVLRAAAGDHWCDCNVPAFEGVGQHAPGCRVFQRPRFHFKQWGSWAPSITGERLVMPDGRTAPSSITIDAAGIETHGAQYMRYAGAGPKSGGKLLDGAEWCEIPRALTPA